MHLSIKKIKSKFLLKKQLLRVVVFLGLISCAENSDKIVADSLDVKEFESDKLNDDSFNFNTSNLIESVVMVEGVVQDVNYLNNRSTIILKGKENNQRLVICDMQDNQKLKIKSLNLGDKVSVKGILKGSLRDIILLNCVIPQPKTNE